MTDQVRDWLYGLGTAFIGGGSSAFAGGSAAALIAPETFNLGAGLGHTVKLTAAIFMMSGLTHVFAYLQKRPLPEWTKTTETHSVEMEGASIVTRDTLVKVKTEVAPVSEPLASVGKAAEEIKP